ncbi:hypothetical protein ColKHC_05803 [Colletotrichum higginsianum]|nr:hypothetical protein ColKHC_05803 [Colletotrichum higginsianum]
MLLDTHLHKAEAVFGGRQTAEDDGIARVELGDEFGRDALEHNLGVLAGSVALDRGPLPLVECLKLGLVDVELLLDDGLLCLVPVVFTELLVAALSPSVGLVIHEALPVLLLEAQLELFFPLRIFVVVLGYRSVLHLVLLVLLGLLEKVVLFIRFDVFLVLVLAPPFLQRLFRRQRVVVYEPGQVWCMVGVTIGESNVLFVGVLFGGLPEHFTQLALVELLLNVGFTLIFAADKALIIDLDLGVIVAVSKTCLSVGLSAGVIVFGDLFNLFASFEELNTLFSLTQELSLALESDDEFLTLAHFSLLAVLVESETLFSRDPDGVAVNLETAAVRHRCV